MTFEVAADAYDAFMGRWSRRLSGPLADFAGVGRGRRVLDVGAGTGALTAELVARVGAQGVTAVEPSDAFAPVLRERFPGVDVRQAPAERLPFEDGTFDAALAQLVVHFMADPVGGLAEMARVTRRDGVVAASVWDHAGARGPLRAFWQAARAIDPDVADESERPGTRSGQLAELLTAAGLRRVQETALEVTLTEPSFEAWWQPFEGGAGPAGAFVARLAPDERTRLREACRRLLPAGPVSITAIAWAARGRA